MTRLSVNVNKIATLRNARGGDVPNLIKVAQDCERFGAQGITVHPRPDERHIRYQDVFDLKKVVTTEFNIEGYPNEKFINLVLEVQPEQVTLVPDPPGVLTSNAGWDAIAQHDFLYPIIHRFKSEGIRVSMFMETDPTHYEAAKSAGTDRIELYTGPFAEQFNDHKDESVVPFTRAAEHAKELGLGLNAGHDLNLDNLAFFQDHVTELLEVSIGHALISDALYLGLENTIQQYLKALNWRP